MELLFQTLPRVWQKRNVDTIIMQSVECPPVVAPMVWLQLVSIMSPCLVPFGNIRGRFHFWPILGQWFGPFVIHDSWMFFCLPASSKGCCLNPKEWCFWALGTGHPLSSIQHPLEDPGMSTVIGRGYVPIDRYVSHSKPRFSSPEIFCQTDIYIYTYIS